MLPGGWKRVADISPATNAAQALRWNGESGEFWVTHRERHLAGHQNLVPHLFGAAAISPGDRVLDIGCGCGATTITAASAAHGTELGLGGYAVGLDLSGVMLGVAQQLARQAEVRNIGFVRGDAQVRLLRPESFDVVISSFGVMFFDDPVAAFSSIAAALRPGARMAFLCWQPDMRNEIFSIPLRAFAEHVRSPESTASDLFLDPKAITELLGRTGWADMGVRALTEPAWMGSDVADVMAYVSAMRTVRALIAELADDALTDRVLANIAEQYAARQRPGGIWVTAAAWLVTGCRI
jgi:SAM-dependent methyltransferase